MQNKYAGNMYNNHDMQNMQNNKQNMSFQEYMTFYVNRNMQNM